MQVLVLYPGTNRKRFLHGALLETTTDFGLRGEGKVSIRGGVETLVGLLGSSHQRERRRRHRGTVSGGPDGTYPDGNWLKSVMSFRIFGLIRPFCQLFGFFFFMALHMYPICICILPYAYVASYLLIGGFSCRRIMGTPAWVLLGIRRVFGEWVQQGSW